MKKLNTPNKLTLTRMICVVLIIVCFALELTIKEMPVIYKYSLTRLIILTLFVFGSITDALDGHIARKHNLITTFGKFLDPIADKLLVNVTAIYAFSQSNWLIIIPIIYIFRDTIVDGIRLICAQKNVVIAASFYGKLKTTTQMIALILALVLVPLFGVENDTLRIIAKIIVYVTAVISAFISLLSGFEYLKKYKNYITED